MFQVNRSWPYIIRLALVLQVSGTIVRYAFPGLLSKYHVFALAVAVLVLKLIIDVPKAVQRYVQARRNGASLGRGLLALIPVEVIALFRLERATQRAFVSWVLRKPPVEAPTEGTSFGYYKNSQYSTIFVIVILACATEVPFSYLMVGIIEKDAVTAQYIHAFLAISVVYTILLLLGDRQLIRYTRHVAGSDYLELRVGVRFKAEIPWSAVQDVFIIKNSKELKEARSSWLRRNGFEPSETVTGTPIDGPNVALILDTSVPVKIEKFKIERHAVRNILLYVDEPMAFVRAVQKRHLCNASSHAA